VWFYASRGQSVEKSYTDLCQLLHIRAYPHISKARLVLQPSLEELTEIGYLSSWELSRTTQGGEFKLALSPGKRLLSLPNFASVTNAEARAALEATLPMWVSELVKRGVAERKARQLVLDIADTQPVLDQIEYADYLISQDRRGRGKISNPAGFYIWAIEQNLSVPEEFQTSGRLRQMESAQSDSEDEHAKSLQVREQYEDFCQTQVSRKIEKEYPAERLEVTIREQMKLLKREQPQWFERVPDAIRREVALCRIRTIVKESLDLPSFECWLKSEPQIRMF
jgi:hypothetical protein